MYFLLSMFGAIGNSQPSTSGTALTLINNSGQTVCYVYISPTTDTTWGYDWLDSTETVSNGSRRVFQVESGIYDLRADDCNGNEIESRWGINVSGNASWSIGNNRPSGSGRNATLTLINNSGQTVCYVYISPTTDTTWGYDWLDSTETVSNGSRRVFQVESGIYDLRADDCSNNAIRENWGVEIINSMNWTLNP